MVQKDLGIMGLNVVRNSETLWARMWSGEVRLWARKRLITMWAGRFRH